MAVVVSRANETVEQRWSHPHLDADGSDAVAVADWIAGRGTDARVDAGQLTTTTDEASAPDQCPYSGASGALREPYPRTCRSTPAAARTPGPEEVRDCTASQSLMLVHGAGSEPSIYEGWADYFRDMLVQAIDLQATLDVARASMADYAERVVRAAAELPQHDAPVLTLPSTYLRCRH